MSDNFRIAIAQSHISADVRANGAHVRELMERAHDNGVRLIHFPEGALSGYIKAQIKSWDDVDWNLVRSELEATAELSGRLGLWTVVGCNRQLTPPNRPHNSLFVISDKGQIVTRYDKRFCSFSELQDWYTPGSEPCVFSVDGFRFGCALCIEIQFMELFGEYEQYDVDCVLYSAFAKDPMFWTQAQGYAASNNYWISVATPAQCSTLLASGAVGPNGNPIARSKGNGRAELIIATLDRASPEFDTAINKARPWRKAARLSGLQHSLSSDDPRSRDRSSI